MTSCLTTSGAPIDSLTVAFYTPFILRKSNKTAQSNSKQNFLLTQKPGLGLFLPPSTLRGLIFQPVGFVLAGAVITVIIIILQYWDIKSKVYCVGNFMTSWKLLKTTPKVSGVMYRLPQCVVKFLRQQSLTSVTASAAVIQPNYLHKTHIVNRCGFTGQHYCINVH